MDTMKLLLGATIALLLGAFVVSMRGTSDTAENAPPEELAKIHRALAEIEAQNALLAQERELRQLRELDTAGPGSPVRPSAESEQASAARAQMEELQARLAEMETEREAERIEREVIERERDRAQRDARVFEEESVVTAQRDLERSDRDMARARRIREESLVARVKEFTPSEYGDIVVLEVLMPDAVREGYTLAVRRNSGILCNVRISSTSHNEAVGDVIPGPGPATLVPGDELIYPPD